MDTPHPANEHVATRSVNGTTKLDMRSPIDGVQVTPLGLIIDPTKELSEDDFNELFSSTLSLSRSANWLLGDALNLADRAWGNKTSGSKYKSASQQLGLSVSTLKHISSVCKAFPYGRRVAGLSFTHHVEAHTVSESPTEVDSYLKEAEEQGMSAGVFRKHLRDSRMAEAERKAWEGGDENLDRPFGLIDLPTERVGNYPLAEEVTRISAWFSGRDLRKLPAAQRAEMLSDLKYIFQDGYVLFQLEKEANPDAEFGLPFDIAPLSEDAFSSFD